MPEGFTSKEVVAITRISPRQLQWWDERGIVVPARQGHKRIYSRDDLAEVAVICELRDRRFSLQKIRRVLRFLQRELGKRLVETVTASSDYHLLTDGRNIFLEDSARAVVDILKNARQPMLTICLSDTIQRILSSGERAGSTRPVKGRLRPEAEIPKKRSGSVRHLTARRRKAS